jgi:hypothetical protein
MTQRALPLGAAVGALIALGVSGCSSPGTPDVELAAVATLDRATQSIGLPLDKYFLSPQDLSTVQHANALILEDCMIDLGFQFPPAQLENWDRPGVITDRRYGVWDIGSVADVGYDLPPADRRSVEPPDFDRPEGWFGAYDQCLEDTKGAVLHEYAENQSDQSLADRGAMESYQKAAGTDVWKQTRQKWIDCLAAKDVLMPSDPDAWVPILPESKEGQIKIALIDVSCKDENQLVQTLADLEATFQAQFQQEHEADLANLKTQVEATVADAQAVISSHGG